MLELRFGAMGTSCELLVDAPESSVVRRALRAAEREVIRLEALLSRFQPDTELSRLNRDGRVRAGPELLEVVRLALKARRRTGGRFDPTVLPALVAAGTTGDFESISQRTRSAAQTIPRCGGRVRIDDATRVIEVDAGVQLDLGGIAKGWTARSAVPDARSARPGAGQPRRGHRRVPASGDGNLARGRRDAEGPLTIALGHGGLATSGRDRRRWRHGDEDSTTRSTLQPVVRRPPISSA